MEINLYTKTGNKSESKVELMDSIWAVPMNKDLVAQVIYVYLNNKRKHTANVKTRGEVSGGGRKPWKQKHTGRARQGSIRSPLWVKGGVAFGPTGQKRKLKISKKMKDLSLKCLLSDKAKGKDILVMREIGTVTAEQGKGVKTRDMANLLEKLGVSGKKVLVIFDSKVENRDFLRRGFKNIKKVSLSDALNICSYDVVNADKLVVSEKAVKEFEERLK